jgi:hypothetical protein
MILWLASYPKSGNTFLRAMLSSYFYSDEGKFDFELLKNIQQFPDKAIFEKIGVDVNNTYEVAKNYIKAQEFINNSNKLIFLKTHSSFCKLYNQFNFSNLKNSLGVIYVVRDPRNVVSSYANHISQTIEQTTEFMINDITTGNDKKRLEVYIGSWNFNYNSWKVFKNSNKYYMVRYEDLINNTKDELIKLIKFINKLSQNNFLIDQKKIDIIIEQTKFSRMKKMENEQGFVEAKINDNTGKKVTFFNLGPKNNWENHISNEIRFKIENKFQKEMKELGYL